MPTVAPIGYPIVRFVDRNGKSAANGKAYTYLAGSTTLAPTYADATGIVPNPNPIPLNSRGEAAVYYDITKSYKIVPTLADGTQLPVQDDLSFVTTSATSVLQALAGPGAGKGASLVGFQSALSGAVPRTLQQLGEERLSAASLGVLSDGSDTTLTLQAAINTAAAAGIPLYLTQGAYYVSILTLPSNLILIGDGKYRSVIRRIPNAVDGAVINAVGAYSVQLSHLTIDGNSPNQTTGANNLVFQSGYDVTLNHVRSIRAKAVAGYGFGAFIINQSNEANFLSTRIEACDFEYNDDVGLAVNKTGNLTLIGNLFSSNGADGFSLGDLEFPPVPFVQNNIQIVGNRSVNNKGCGLYVLGFYVGGTAGAPQVGNSIPPQSGVVISGNVCTGNGIYGIFAQGRGLSINGNHLEANGTGTDGGGICANAIGSTINANTLVNNAFWGIDAGGSQGVIVSNNTFNSHCASSGNAGVHINLGATVSCKAIGNIIDMSLSYGANGLVGISASGVDYGDATFFNQTGIGLTIHSNDIQCNNTTHIGIQVVYGFNDVSLIGNSVLNANPGNAFILECGLEYASLIERDNIDWGSGILPTIASAATIVIPDVGGDFVVSGSANISAILTRSANVYAGKVRFCEVTVSGSGYSPSSPPSVTFSGGGGTGAAGIAQVTSAGNLIGISMTSDGTGYTSSPTVTIAASPSGSPSNASALALIGCNNFMAKRLILQFLDAATLTPTNNLRLNGSFTSAGTGNSIIELRGAFNVWYEIARRV